MTEILDRIVYRGYAIEILPDYDAGNPFDEFDDTATLALHQRAERHFGWSTDKEWAQLLQDKLNEIAQQGVIEKLYGPGGALEAVNDWLRADHGIPVVLPVSALEHSGVLPYLGASEHPSDPGGWDSGWVGWLFATPEQLKLMELTDPTQIEQSLRASFAEFAAWVSGDVVGYRIVDGDDTELTSSWAIYGSDTFREPDGWGLAECKAIIDADITEKGTLRAL